MGRAHGGRENQLTLLAADPHTIIREAWEQHGKHLIRRTAMLSGGNDSATLAHWLAWHGYVDELLFRPALDVVNDQRGSPTYAVDLARAIIQLCRKGATGIVHATNSGNCTWFEFAGEI